MIRIRAPRSILVPALALVSGLAIAVPVLAQSANAERIERRYRVEIGGQRVGWARSVFDRIARNDEVILVYEEALRIAFGRLGQSASIASRTRYEEREDGGLVAVEALSEMSNRE